MVASGAFVWVLSPPGSLTLGASGVVFGWLTYLLVRGFFSRSAGQIALAVLVFVLYGGILWGVLPGTVGVSWQGHLGGAVGGALAAWWLHRRADAHAMTAERPVFVLHEHDKPRHHFDLRLEEDGVLRSWAVPRGLPVGHPARPARGPGGRPRPRPRDVHRRRQATSPTPAGGSWRTATSGGSCSCCTVATAPAATRSSTPGATALLHLVARNPARPAQRVTRSRPTR